METIVLELIKIKKERKNNPQGRKKGPLKKVERVEEVGRNGV